MLLKNWTKSTHSSRNVMLAALVLIGTIAVYNWIVAPHAGYLLAAQRHRSVISKLTEKNQIINNNVAIKRKKLKELREKFRQVHAALFDPIEAKDFLSDIQAASEEANCTMQSLNFSQTDSALKAKQSKAGSHITANRATLSVVGNYRNLVALMNKLQDGLRQVWIDSISIRSIRNNPDQLECDMTVTVYVIQK